MVYDVYENLVLWIKGLELGEFRRRATYHVKMYVVDHLVGDAPIVL